MSHPASLRRPIYPIKKTLLTLGVLAMSGAIPAALLPSPASAATTPVVYASDNGWSSASVHPAWIWIGEGGSPAAHIRHWSTWDQGEPSPHATANGTLWTDNCLPNCAEGKESAHRLLVTLSAVRTHRGDRYYSRMTWYTPGYRLYGQHTSTAVLHYGPTGGTMPFWH